MVSKSIEEALNQQVHHELGAAYLYLAMAAYFEAEGLGGFAKWMRMQSREEVGHAMRLFDYVHDRGGRATLRGIDEPPAEFESPLGAFEQALAHEREVTSQIHRLYGMAREENDHATEVMLQWFIEEQVEEEKSAGGVVEQIKRAQDSPAALLMLDRELAERGEE